MNDTEVRIHTYTGKFENVGLCRVSIYEPRRYMIRVSDVTCDGEPVKCSAYVHKPPMMENTVGRLQRGDLLEWHAPKLECWYPKDMHKVET